MGVQMTDKKVIQLAQDWNANSVGYLVTDLDYAKMNKWQQGFGIVEYEEDGSFTFHNKTILNGSIY